MICSLLDVVAAKAVVMAEGHAVQPMFVAEQTQLHVTAREFRATEPRLIWAMSCRLDVEGTVTRSPPRMRTETAGCVAVKRHDLEPFGAEPTAASG